MAIASRIFSSSFSAPLAGLAMLCGILSFKQMSGDLNSGVKASAGQITVPKSILPGAPKIPVTSFDRSIDASASEYRLDPLLLKAIISVESEFNDHCVSPKGAAGLMQLLPATARILEVRDIFDPEDNIHGGARHFRYLMDRFHNDLPKSLAAYNAGEKPVIRYHGIPPYPETQKYVMDVLKTYNSYRPTQHV